MKRAAYPIETAPRDGTRILLLHTPMQYDRRKGYAVPTGEKWEEAHYLNGYWKPWCGSLTIQSTESLQPIGWRQLP